jgi:hypothetical protein
MVRIIAAFILASAALLSFTSFAEASVDGKTALGHCVALIKVWTEGKAPATAEEGSRAGFCSGMMAGIMEMNAQNRTAGLQGGPTFCAPDDMKFGDMAKIIVEYLNSHRDNLQEDGVGLAIQSLKEAYPCR